MSDDSRKDEDLNFKYKDQTNEERFLDNVIRASEKESDETGANNTNKTATDTSTDPSTADTSKKKITKEEIMKSVMEQAKQIKRDDKTETIGKTQLGTSNSKVQYSDVAKTISWFNEYTKQPIEVTRERVRTYLKYYKDLPKLIKLREQKIISGEAKPESKYLEPHKLPTLEFLNGSKVDKHNFLLKVDYKMCEMDFYNRNLIITLEYLKKYMFMGYQFLMLKYYFNFEETELIKSTNIKQIDYMDKILIDYIYEKLIEERNKECQN